MVLLRVGIRLNPTQRPSVQRSLIRILEPTRALPGCLGCRLCADLEDENALLYVEEWADEAHLAARLRSDSVRVLLAAVDCAVDRPQVQFDTISQTKGIELIAACRNGKPSI